MTTYIVNTGINYPPNQRKEPGETVTDKELPKESIRWLTASGAITAKPKSAKEKETSS